MKPWVGAVALATMWVTSAAWAAPILDGDILVTELAGADAVLRVDPVSGTATELASVGSIEDVAVTPDGRVFVSTSTEFGTIFEIDPDTGGRTELVGRSAGFLGAPFMVPHPSGDLIISTAIRSGSSAPATIARVDSLTGDFEIISTSSTLGIIDGLAVGSDGSIFVTANPGLVRIDPVTGDQEILLALGATSRALAVEHTGNLVFTEAGVLTRYDLALGTTEPIATLSGIGVLDLGVEQDGSILASVSGSELVRVDPQSGAVSLFAEISGLRKIGVASLPEPTTGLLVVTGLIAAFASPSTSGKSQGRHRSARVG